MGRDITLASGSQIRAKLLRNAGVELQVVPARIDEEAIRASLLAEDVAPRDIADALAEAKARKISQRQPGALVLGCDQVAALGGTILTKPADRNAAETQLRALSGQRHQLLSAAVLHENGQPVWRHVGLVRLTMHDLSDTYIDAYLDRNWHSIRDAVGGYKLEQEGVRLFSRIEGDYFNVLGLPLIELLSYLTQRGDLEI